MSKSATLMVNPEEAMMIDYLITLHSYDPAYLELLKTSMFTSLRTKAATIIAADSEGLISFTDAEVEHLLITIPIDFRFLEKPCGYSLKVKLFKSQLPVMFSFQVKPEEPINESTALPIPLSEAPYQT
jgi:hypothetical protein